MVTASSFRRDLQADAFGDPLADVQADGAAAQAWRASGLAYSNARGTSHAYANAGATPPGSMNLPLRRVKRAWKEIPETGSELPMLGPGTASVRRRHIQRSAIRTQDRLNRRRPPVRSEVRRLPANLFPP